MGNSWQYLLLLASIVLAQSTASILESDDRANVGLELEERLGQETGQTGFFLAS